MAGLFLTSEKSLASLLLPSLCCIPVSRPRRGTGFHRIHKALASYIKNLRRQTRIVDYSGHGYCTNHRKKDEHRVHLRSLGALVWSAPR
jgi:hypothetical protein